MKTRYKLVILDLVGGACSCVWILAAIASIYFLYGVLATGQAWSSLLWPIASGLVAKQFSSVLRKRRRRLSYVDRLSERGVAKADAEAAWRTASEGGTNMLRNLQQAELGDEINRLEMAIGTQDSEDR